MADFLTGAGAVRETAVQSGFTQVRRYGNDLTFSDVLRSRLEQETGITFSAHSMERLRERGIQLSTGELERLSGAVNRASEKGADDSLILIDDRAFIVSVKNRTVVTAMSGESIKGNVFTNIDSTVIA